VSAEKGDKLVLERFRKRGLTGIALALFQRHLASLGIVPSEHDFDTYLKNKQAEKTKPSSEPPE